MPLLPTILALGAAIPHLSAARAPEPPVIDGRLDELAWKRAAPSDAFTQKRPDQGVRPVERTRVRILYDDDALYVGVECDQTAAPVIARLTRRDRQVEADSVAIGLDTKGDGKTAFEFSVNAAGVLSDGLYSNDTDFSRDWDEIWDGRTSVTKSGWSAEIRIPLHALRYDPKPVQSFGLQVRRYVSARQELDEWSYSPRETAGEVSLYGRLDNLLGLRHKNYVELLPYVAGKIRYDDPADAVSSGFSPGGSVGLDLRWHVTPQLTLNATVNPDFGQVEADPAVLNLGTIETFYPEKRPFFLEGADTFATPLALLYTRRIGRAPDSPAVLEEPPFGEALAEDPEPATIYGAEKLVGEVGGRVSVGQLIAVTGRQRVSTVRPGGEVAQRVADPLTTFKVLRLRRDFGERGQIGVIGLATNRLEPSGEYPVRPAGAGGPARQLCPGGEETRVGARCFHDSYVGGVDARWRSPSGDYVLSGQMIGSLVKNGPPRTLLDGTVVSSGDVAPAGQIRVAKEGGAWRGDLFYQGHGQKVDYNDLGYMRRQNLHEVQAVLQYKTVNPWWKTRETTTNLVLRDWETLDFLNLQRVAALNSSWTLQNSWEVFAEAFVTLPHYDDREVGDGAALQRTGVAGGAFFLGTDPRSRVRGELFAAFEAGMNGGGEAYGELIATFKVLPQLDVSLMPTVLYTYGEPRYFATEGSSYLFGDLLAQSLSLTLRATYTFTPRLTLEAYAQAFLASEHYTDYTSYPVSASGAPARIDQDALGPAPATVETNPSYESGTLNANVVLRWEYRPGSTLYAVYTHGQSDELTPAVSDGAGLSFRLLKPRPSSDVLLLKLSYWWG